MRGRRWRGVGSWLANANDRACHADLQVILPPLLHRRIMVGPFSAPGPSSGNFVWFVLRRQARVKGLEIGGRGRQPWT